MQRLALSSKEQHHQANVSAKEGKELFNKYLAKKMPAPTAETTTSKCKGKGKKSSETVTKRNLVKHHLGIWHGRGEVMLGWTSETTYHKYKDEAFKPLAMEYKCCTCGGPQLLSSPAFLLREEFTVMIQTVSHHCSSTLVKLHSLRCPTHVPTFIKHWLWRVVQQGGLSVVSSIRVSMIRNQSVLLLQPR